MGKKTELGDGKWLILPPGMTVKPLYDKCPRCGCDLQEFYKTEEDKAKSDHIKQDANWTGVPGVINMLHRRRVKGSRLYRLVHWMIHPFAYSPYNTPKADHERFSCRIVGEESRPVKQDDESPNHKDDFVPVVKSKFRKWILHVWKFLFKPFSRY